MVRCLKLELFVLRSVTQTFTEMTANVMEVLFKHHDPTVLQESVHTLTYLSHNGPEELKVDHVITRVIPKGCF